jgi:hypothetical protein
VKKHFIHNPPFRHYKLSVDRICSRGRWWKGMHEQQSQNIHGLRGEKNSILNAVTSKPTANCKRSQTGESRRMQRSWQCVAICFHQTTLADFVSFWPQLRSNIMFLHIINRPVQISKHDVSETGFWLCLQMEPTQVGPEIGTSSIDWAQLSGFYLKTKTESSLQDVVFWNTKQSGVLDKNKTDSVQKNHICHNVPSPQTVWN